RFVLDNHPIRIAGAANAPAAIQVGGAPDQSVLTAYQRLCDSLDSLPHPTDSLPTLNPYRMDSIDRHIDSLKLHFVRSHSTSVVSAYALYRDLAYLRSSKELHQLYTGFTPEVRQTPYAQQILRMAQALDKTAIGQPYRDLSLPDTLGAPLPLSTLVGEGRYTLLYFWASWCTPCYTDLPVLARTHRIFRSRGFQIYAISLDRRHKTWTETLRNQNLRWNHVCDLKGWHSPALADYGVRSIPYNILIGPDGQIIARNLWGDDLLWKVSEYLGSPYRQDSTQQNQITPLDGETSSGGIETAADSTVHE
ncbi:MAG: TlpA disulfide reductase family protein, partial [Alistipes sp.]|nr:TlpA disulfide reductase family protein [Alistipes sp.]